MNLPSDLWFWSGLSGVLVPLVVVPSLITASDARSISAATKPLLSAPFAALLSVLCGLRLFPAPGREVEAREAKQLARLRQASITPQLLEWKRLENQRAMIERWNGSVPQTVLGNKTNLLIPFPAEQK